jgi:hypothetical protein
MRVKLDKKWIARLVQLPESGMGYQRVDLRLQDGRELKDVTVFNAEELDLPDDLARVGIKDIRLHAA